MPVRRQPCRLYGMFAREAPRGVLFRRGPSKDVQLIAWNVSEDSFEAGQWFRGRIYEHCGDLSPDGSLLVYYAAKRDRSRPYDENTWIAISRPPYLTALAIWFFAGTAGGGMFGSNSAVSLYRLGSAKPGQDADRVPLGMSELRFETCPFETCPSESHERTRLLRDGWRVAIGDHPQRRVVTRIDRPFGEGRLHASLSYHSRTYEWIDGGGTSHPLERVSWADVDPRGRLAIARDGKILVAEPSTGPPEFRELADFDGNRFAPLEAPEWATRWPEGNETAGD